jgi:undecaprenyl pyrophosphate phosphatase UppP
MTTTEIDTAIATMIGTTGRTAAGRPGSASTSTAIGAALDHLERAAAALPLLLAVPVMLAHAGLARFEPAVAH